MQVVVAGKQTFSNVPGLTNKKWFSPIWKSSGRRNPADPAGEVSWTQDKVNGREAFLKSVSSHPVKLTEGTQNSSKTIRFKKVKKKNWWKGTVKERLKRMFSIQVLNSNTCSKQTTLIIWEAAGYSVLVSLFTEDSGFPAAIKKWADSLLCPQTESHQILNVQPPAGPQFESGVVAGLLQSRGDIPIQSMLPRCCPPCWTQTRAFVWVWAQKNQTLLD